MEKLRDEALLFFGGDGRFLQFFSNLGGFVRFSVCLCVFLSLFLSCAGKKQSVSPASMPAEKSDPYFNFVKMGLEELEGNKNPSPSLDVLNKTIAEHPRYAFLHFLKAQTLARKGDLTEAIISCKKALSLDRGLQNAQVFLAQLYIGNQQYRQAVSLLEGILAEDPTREEVYPLLAHQYVALGETKQAIKTMEKLLQQQPESVLAHLYIASVYERELKDYTKALEAYEKAYQLDPENTNILHTMARLYLSVENWQEALKRYEKIEEMNPNDLSASLRIALIYYEAGKFEEATKKFQFLLKKNPNSDNVQFYLGVLYQSIEKYPEAEEVLLSISSRSEFFKEARIRLVSQYRALEQDEKALKLLSASEKELPDASEFYELHAALLEQEQKLKEALAVLESAKVHLPQSENIFLMLGMMYERLGKRDMALSSMRKVIEINPQNTTALNYVGYTLAESSQNLEEAKNLIERALTLKPNDAYITDSLAWVYFKQGELENAYKLLMKALKIASYEPTILYHLGEVSLAQEQKDQALEYFQQALKAWETKPEQDILEVEKIKNRISELEK
ncbi:MAG: hypothetical protein COX62_05595 [Deltaproteobacteria bacterium CG_4_10_14_0_2_um_filter_43_8]|nr:MAG: hypothetical protein COV43_05110 [Deltaproteobacteria bacterium CG11_big_fil_rev_8_21_14_0_20_42_23]PJA19957.1 MAG: hypothetical protein COX62_05595 [Deltaproteobacteria bacterium CG_4_10_14_0_2_um_filter_43_8]PJC63609.1 MAG: hypothetical protein CO021_08590 [Deltaproteobacteria bacterium CG_4_9_14_0_2_um_filter_42_21]